MFWLKKIGLFLKKNYGFQVISAIFNGFLAIFYDFLNTKITQRRRKSHPAPSPV